MQRTLWHRRKQFRGNRAVAANLMQHQSVKLRQKTQSIATIPAPQ
ncbi:hypothetical protein Z950_1762 [Sulfitobacter mediterraneus KCTC 32188]|nr:hypothetical protein Z950_1762 [Sulfitobacter mediterraneus KCTC 32188]